MIILDKLTKINFPIYYIIAFLGINIEIYNMNKFKNISIGKRGYLKALEFKNRDNSFLVKSLYFRYTTKNPFSIYMPKYIEKTLNKFFLNIDNVVIKILHVFENFIYSYQTGILVAYAAQEKSSKTIFIVHSDLSNYLYLIINPEFKSSAIHLYNPLDDIYKVLSLSINLFLKLFDIFINKSFFFFKNKKVNIDNKTNVNYKKYKVGIIFHGNNTYGNLYDKSHYFSKDKKSPLYKDNMLHFYSAFSNKNLLKNKNESIFLYDIKLANKFLIIALRKTFILFISLLPNLKNPKEILGTILICLIYIKYLKWKNIFSKYELTDLIIDFDINFSKSISLALESLSVNTISINERPFLLGLHPWGVIVNKYFLPGEIYRKYAESNNSYIFNDSYILGQWRTKYFYKFKENTIKSVNFAKSISNKKSIMDFDQTIVFLGLFLKTNVSNFYVNKTANEKFFSIISEFSGKYPEKAIILRMKHLNFGDLEYIVDKFKDLKNFFLCDDYSKFGISYLLCKKADLIISVPTSLAEESLAYGKYVLFIDDLFTVNPYSSYLYPQEFQFAIPRNNKILFSKANKILKKEKSIISKYHNLSQSMLGECDLSLDHEIPQALEKSLKCNELI